MSTSSSLTDIIKASASYPIASHLDELVQKRKANKRMQKQVDAWLKTYDPSTSEIANAVVEASRWNARDVVQQMLMLQRKISPKKLVAALKVAAARGADAALIELLEARHNDGSWMVSSRQGLSAALLAAVKNSHLSTAELLVCARNDDGSFRTKVTPSVFAVMWKKWDWNRTQYHGFLKLMTKMLLQTEPTPLRWRITSRNVPPPTLIRPEFLALRNEILCEARSKGWSRSETLIRWRAALRRREY